MTTALPALFHQLTLVEALTVESVLMFAAGVRRDVWVARGGTLLFAIAGLQLFGATWAEPPALTGRIDIALGLWLVGGAYVLRGIRAIVPRDGDVLHDLARVGIDILALNALSRVCLDTLGGNAWNVSIPSHAQFALSIVWTLYAASLFGYGLRRRVATLRWEGIALFGATILKVFAIDLSSVDLEYRIGSFIVLGVVLFAASAWYTRTMSHAAVGPAE